MPRIKFAPDVRTDFDRIRKHLAKHKVADSSMRISAILDALAILAQSPYIGRRFSHDATDPLRDLVIGKDAHGYIALYRYEPADETVFVLAVKSQREAGYHVFDEE
jgi:toxin ParE1/3/4